MYTGERIMPGGIFSVTYYQSLVAYLFAQSLSQNATVLDVACGEGYGTAQLGTVAKRCIGVDQNQETIASAQQKYARENVSFFSADLFRLSSLPEHGFDVVCCFQTIEHMVDHDAFLAALREQVRPGGRLIISTPNRRMFPTFNPYHVHELDLAEITTLCQRNFPAYQLFGVFGDQAVLDYRTSKQRLGRFLLALDVFNLRQYLPRVLIKLLYGWVSLFVIKRLSWWQHRKAVKNISTKNFTISSENLGSCLDFIVVAQISP